MFIPLTHSFIHSIFICHPCISNCSGHCGDKDEPFSASFFKDLIITLVFYPHQMSWPSSCSFWLLSSILTDILSLKEIIAFVFLLLLNCEFWVDTGNELCFNIFITPGRCSIKICRINEWMNEQDTLPQNYTWFVICSFLICNLKYSNTPMSWYLSSS